MHPTTRAAFAAGAVLLSACSGAFAGGTITQQFPFTFDVDIINARVIFDNFQAFDDMDGRRTLTGVSLSTTTDYFIAMTAENLEDYAIQEGEWFYGSSLHMDIAVNEQHIVSQPTIDFGDVSVDLEANDGNQYIGFDSIGALHSGTYSATTEIFPDGFSFFQDDRPFQNISVYPFLGLTLLAPPPRIDLNVDAHTESGLFTVTYTFEEIPSPAGAALLGLAGVCSTRRKRS